MSIIKAVRHQLGLSNTPANNFTLDASADNGTMKLARGIAGSPTQDVMTIDAAGRVGFPQNPAIVNVLAYGAKGDGVTDASSAIQSAISACSAAGGGFVDFNFGTYIINATLVLPSKVVLRGQGASVTILKAKNGLNATVVKSYNYDSLVGSDTWLVASGNQHAFGFQGLKIDGNKLNQTSGTGIQVYGKRFTVEDVIITSCKEEGWHSEGNQTIPGTPAHDGSDMPESRISGLYIWECDSHGFVFRGSHDSIINGLFVGVCGGWGVRFETDTVAPGVYSGNCNSTFMHIYANVAGGVFVGPNATHKGSYIITENNDGVGLELQGWQCQIAQLEMYSNCRVTGSFQALMSGSQCSISNAMIKDTGQSKGGIQIVGTENVFDGTLQGAGSTGVGVDVYGVYQRVNATVSGFSGTGGIGVRTGNGTQLQQSQISAVVSNSKIGWSNASVGSSNNYNINGYFVAGQVGFSGSLPNTVDGNEFWNCRFNENGTAKYSEMKYRGLNSIDMNSTAVQTFVIPHGLLATPEYEDVVCGYGYYNANTTWVFSRPPAVSAIDATNITVKCKLSVAAGSADVGDLFVSAKL